MPLRTIEEKKEFEPQNLINTSKRFQNSKKKSIQCTDVKNNAFKTL